MLFDQKYPVYTDALAAAGSYACKDSNHAYRVAFFVDGQRDHQEPPEVIDANRRHFQVERISWKQYDQEGARKTVAAAAEGTA